MTTSMIKYISTIIFFTVFFNNYIVQGQTKLDALFGVWSDENQQDTVRLLALDSLIWANNYNLFKTDSDSTFSLAQEGYKFAEAINNPFWIAKMQFLQGRLFHENREYEKAIEYFEKSEKSFLDIGKLDYSSDCLFQKVGVYYDKAAYNQQLKHAQRYLSIVLELGDSLKIAKGYFSVAVGFTNQGKHTEAIENHMNSLKIYELKGKLLDVAHNLNSIGIILFDVGDDEQALEYYQKSLKYSKELGNQKFIQMTVNNIANIHTKNKNYDKAIELHYENIESGESKRYLAMAHGNLGSVYSKIGDYEKAIHHQKISLALEEEIGNLRGMPFSLKEIGLIYASQNDHKTALVYFNKGLKISQKLGLPYRIEYCSFNAYKSYKAIGHHRKALEMYELYITKRDRNQDQDQMRAVIKKGAQYEHEKEILADSLAYVQEKLILENNIKNERNQRFWILGIAVILGLLFFQSYRNGRTRKLTNQALEESNKLLGIKNQQNEVLLKEIHHRVKNNLQTISSLLSLQSNSIADQGALDAVQESQNRVASMALIHQKLYQGENLAAIEMRDYFETIGTEILSSFGEKATDVELEVNMPEMELDVDTAIPIGLITNELLTNSLKYAFREKESGKISIAMTQQENNLIQLMIKDNGAYTQNSINQGGTGFGTLLIHLLTTQLNGQLEQITTNGTVTIISFPLNHAA